MSLTTGLMPANGSSSTWTCTPGIMNPAQACSSMRWPPESDFARSSASGSRVESSQQLAGARDALGGAARAAGREVRHHQVFPHREIAEHARHLERAHQPARRDQMRAEAGDRRVREPHLAGVGTLDAGDDVDEGGLAGAVRSDQAADLAGRKPHRDAVVGGEAAVALGHALR